MRIRMIGVLVVGIMVAGGFALTAARSASPLVAGGTEVALANWTPGQGMIGPGGKIRGWTTVFKDTLVGPAGEYSSAAGPVVMNCDLDDTVTGPCWGTFEFENAVGKWVGTWQGTFNFATGAGSYKAQGHGQGGMKGMVLENDVVYPGGAFAVNGVPTGYVYSTVKNGDKD
ncbi:MAG: hypothetical protein NTV05_12465 [Acidobacteria bacterium]|nr:hypothetical protein [Acidobacteriota bacterium]